ncbi:MAG TPA: helicase [Romboutsia timonensis]|uniref:Helicase n=1 Tax=Romboutsia timonensis TaxID=1776391 RepID=A0A921N252_9FIRM|nr:helicase [Romboutsia timonensis]
MGKENKITNKEAVQKISELRIISEMNIVSILWKNPDLYFVYDELSIDSFTYNKAKVYYQIGNDIIIKEQKALESITIDMYLEKHDKLKEKYEEYGGYEIVDTGKYVNEENIEGYIEELNKWNVLIKMIKEGFPVGERFSEYIDMSCEDIYDENEGILNHIFSNISSKDKSYKIGYKIEELIDELDQGLAIGLPLYNLPTITNEIGGNINGNITLCGGISGAGKTTFTRNAILPSIVEHDEKICIMVNEEGIKKWQRELIIWVTNNIYNKPIKKYILRNGGFDPKFKTWLKKYPCKWIKDNEDKIIIVPFSQYNTAKAIKTIKKYAALKFKNFILDTYKADSDDNKDSTNPAVMQQNMVKIYDTIKEEALNVHVWITFQLNKSSSKQRCYTQDNIGMAKNIVDVASTCLMLRNLYEDEFSGGKNEIKVYKLSGKNGKTKTPVQLDNDKHYQIVFIVKNREGGSNDFSVVVEHDMATNTLSEVGITYITPDF